MVKANDGNDGNGNQGDWFQMVVIQQILTTFEAAHHPWSLLSFSFSIHSIGYPG